MTRLAENDLVAIDASWHAYETQLKTQTDMDLYAVANSALGMPSKPPRSVLASLRVGVIPISSGEGVILGFAESLVSIAQHLGFQAHCLPPDEAGFQKGRAHDDILLWADDTQFFAENVHTKKSVENGWATGRGFAAVLHTMNKQQKTFEKRALVLGAGPVGQAAATFLSEHNYALTLCDLIVSKAQTLCRQLPNAQACLPEALPTLPPFSNVLDAAPTHTCFPHDLLTACACVAAPCVPCLWSEVPLRVGYNLNLWHDPLQLGTAVMLLGAV